MVRVHTGGMRPLFHGDSADAGMYQWALKVGYPLDVLQAWDLHGEEGVLHRNDQCSSIRGVTQEHAASLEVLLRGPVKKDLGVHYHRWCPVCWDYMSADQVRHLMVLRYQQEICEDVERWTREALRALQRLEGNTLALSEPEWRTLLDLDGTFQHRSGPGLSGSAQDWFSTWSAPYRLLYDLLSDAARERRPEALLAHLQCSEADLGTEVHYLVRRRDTPGVPQNFLGHDSHAFAYYAQWLWQVGEPQLEALAVPASVAPALKSALGLEDVGALLLPEATLEVAGALHLDAEDDSPFSSPVEALRAAIQLVEQREIHVRTDVQTPHEKGRRSRDI